MIAVAPAAPQHRSDVAVDRFDFPKGDLFVAVVEDAVIPSKRKEDCDGNRAEP